MSLAFYLKYYFYYLEAEYEAASAVIKVTVLLATFLMVVFIFSIVHIIVLNLTYLRKKRIKEQFMSFYREKLHEILINPQQLSEIAITDLLRNSRISYGRKNKNLYTECLIELISQIKNAGKTINSKNLLMVINHFQLPNYWQAALLKGRLLKRKEALRKMDQLEQLLSGSLLLHSVYHRNNDFRKQSRAAFIEYDKNNPYSFFEENFDKDFNALDELRVHHYLTKKAATHELPDLSRWVENATLIDFKRFIIQEIGLFRQYNCGDFLIQILPTEANTHIQKQIIETLGVLDYKAADRTLIAMYSSSLALLQKAIINTLSKLKTERTLAFLGESYQQSHDNSIKIQLAYALTDYGFEGQLKMESLSEVNSPFDSEILAEVRFSHSQNTCQTLVPN